MKKIIRQILISIPYVFLIVIIVLAIISPILEYKRLASSEITYKLLGTICHQLPTRCLWIYSSNIGLCTRCFFIYTCLFATGLYVLIKNTQKINWWFSLLLIIPCVVDGGTQYGHLRMSNNLLRGITGALAGIGIGSVIFPLYLRFINYLFKRGD